jgi:type III restriction enzyme
MPELPPKDYQIETLDALANFCNEVRLAVSRQAYRPVNDAFHAATGRNFEDVPQLAGVPYVCLRVPTGGGKTLIAAKAVGTVAKRLGHQDRPLCLWVTPSTTIRDQTLRGLQDRNHFLHAALKESLGVPIEVITLEEALAANRSMMSSSAVIVVTTIQSYRIDDEGNRRIYQDNGYLMDHFSALPAWIRDQLKDADTDRVSLSLANVMKLRGPIVIMDEAHNARTRISFDSLARLGPLAVVELTATPIQEHDPPRELYASNVLHAVSALQLKAEGMIKLPVDLESRKTWTEVLATAIARRKELEQIAATWGQQSGRFIRPIALIQAQPRSKTKETHTVDRVKDALIQLQVPADRIRIATGDNDELGDEDLRHPDCKVEFIITVEKLREGWDCPFAYVLGSVGNVATETAVEQLLGRVLRMPDAKPTGVPELDRAYAVVQSEDIARTAQSLCDNLVRRCGFDRDTVNDVLRVNHRLEGQQYLPLSSIPVASPPAVELSPSLRAKVRYDAESGSIKVHQVLTREEAIELREALPAQQDRVAVERHWQEEREVGTIAKNLDQYAPPLKVPQLAVRQAQGLLRFEPIELDEFSWNLNACDPTFSEADFSGELLVGSRVIVGVTDQGGVRIGGVEEVIVRQQSFLPADDNWEKAELVRWLDAELHRGGQNAGLPKAESQAWLNRVVDHLIGQRAIPIAIVVRKRHELSDLIYYRVQDHGRLQVRRAAESLFSEASEKRLETTDDLAFELAEQNYRPFHQYRSGPFSYQKHAFDLIGKMGNEESQCAKKIDDHPNVKRWIRNLDSESAGGFSLPLAPGRFFPDFLVELNDGRIAIIEYKGGHIAQGDKELHKEDVGELWAARSNGRCVFRRIVDRDWDKLEAALNPVQ